MTLIPIPQDRAEWLALRAGYVGASEVAALFDAQAPYALGRFALWQVKAGRMPAPDVQGERLRWGLLLEDAIAAGAAEMEGWEVLPGIYATHECGLGATLDRRIAAPGPNDKGFTGPGVLELKNADWLQHRRAWGEEPPLHILLQLQAQLLVTGCTWGAVACLVGGNELKVYRYAARPKLLADMAARVAAFWQSIRDGQAPNADASESAWRALVATTELDDAEPLDMTDDDDATALAMEWLRQDAAAKAATKARDAAKNALVQRVGSAARVQGNGWRLSLTDVAETPPKIITADMIGQTIPGRAGSRRATIKEAT